MSFENPLVLLDAADRRRITRESIKQLLLRPPKSVAIDPPYGAAIPWTDKKIVGFKKNIPVGGLIPALDEAGLLPDQPSTKVSTGIPRLDKIIEGKP